MLEPSRESLLLGSTAFRTARSRGSGFRLSAATSRSGSNGARFLCRGFVYFHIEVGRRLFVRRERTLCRKALASKSLGVAPCRVGSGVVDLGSCLQLVRVQKRFVFGRVQLIDDARLLVDP